MDIFKYIRKEIDSKIAKLKNILKKNHLLYIIVGTLLLSYLYYLHLGDTKDNPTSQYVVGQIADQDIIAPFSFQVYKDQEAIEKEKIRIAENIIPIYKVSESINFQIISKIDQFFDNLTILDNELDSDTAQMIVRNNGYILSKEHLEILKDIDDRNELYNYLISMFNSTLSIGIYPDNFPRDEIRLSNNGYSRNLPLKRLFSIQETREKLVNATRNERVSSVLEQIVGYFIIANIVVDNDKTQALINDAYQDIDPVLTEVLENEEIIRKNRKITELDLKKLEALYEHSGQSGTHKTSELGEKLILLSVFGYLILSFLLLFGGYYCFSNLLSERYNTVAHTITFILLATLTILLAFGINKLNNVHHIILPFSLSVVLFALVFTPTGGMLFSPIPFFLVLPFYQWNITVLAPLFIGTILLLNIMPKLKDPHDFLALSVACLVSYLIVIISFSLLTLNNDYVNYLFYGTLSSIISMSGVILLSPVIEGRLNILSKSKLLKLQETNHPLLQLLARTAPGTYNHSLMVGNLAESAAEAIRANSLLAKVGGLYHDIGKINEPKMFVENDSKAPELYDKMTSLDSATQIKSHVEAGVNLAVEYKLPQQVIDIIRQHHGMGKVSFFLEKAKKSDEKVNEKDYRYIGPKPQTKEAVIVMIADNVESTAKAKLDLHSEESFEEMIDKSIKRLINDGQLNEAPITLEELETVKSYMLPILLGVHQKRIDYPQETTEINP